MINKDVIKQYLFNTLKEKGCFWSYNHASMNVSDLSDEFLIEKVLLHLDLNELNLLFRAYPKEQIKEIWRWKVCSLEPYYHSSNIFFAKVYFNIKNAERYIKMQSRRAVRVNLGYGRNITEN